MAPTLLSLVDIYVEKEMKNFSEFGEIYRKRISEIFWNLYCEKNKIPKHSLMVKLLRLKWPLFYRKKSDSFYNNDSSDTFNLKKDEKEMRLKSSDKIALGYRLRFLLF